MTAFEHLKQMQRDAFWAPNSLGKQSLDAGLAAMQRVVDAAKAAVLANGSADSIEALRAALYGRDG